VIRSQILSDTTDLVHQQSSTRALPIVLRAVALMAISALVGMLAIGTSHGDGGQRLSFAWLVNVWFAITICLGMLFFVAIQHLTRAGWSVSIRRFAEIIGGSIAVPILLLSPLVVILLSGSSMLFPWNDPAVISGDPVLAGKQPYLNAEFFGLRTVIYAVVWILTGIWLLKSSQEQDRTGDASRTVVLERRSAPLLILLGLTTTFASFDWLMSLDPHWFSTIFGIYVFSGAMVAGLAVLALMTSAAIRSGLLSEMITREHLHDVAKLLFGFNCFWAYIAFSQYLLIWYANIPEETVWYLHRQEAGWEFVSLGLVLFHFIFPFIGLMSRAAKRSPSLVAAFAALLLFAHWLDLYWIVYPNFSETPVWGPMELLGALFVVSATALVAGRLSQDRELVARSDPRLAEAVNHHVA